MRAVIGHNITDFLKIYLFQNFTKIVENRNVRLVFSKNLHFLAECFTVFKYGKPYISFFISSIRASLTSGIYGCCNS